MISQNSIGIGLSDRPVKAVLFFAGFLGYLVPIILPLMATNIAADLAGSVTSVGVLMGLQGLTVAFASLLIGPASDRYGRRRMLSVFLIFNGLALFAMAQSRSLEMFYLSGFFSAIAFSPLVFCALAYVGDHFKENQRAPMIGLVSGSLYVCVTFGIPLTVLLMSQQALGWRAAFVLFALISSVCGLVSLRALGRGSHSPPVVPASVSGVLKQYIALITEPKLAGFLLIFLVVRLGVGMYFTYGAAYLLTARAFPASGFIWIYPIGGVFAFLVSLRVGKILTKVGSRFAIVASSACLIASVFLILDYPTTPGNIVLAMGVFSTIYMVSESVRMAALYTEAVSKVVLALRGTFLGLINFLIHIGTALGAITGGMLLKLAPSQAGNAQQMQAGFTHMVLVTSLLWLVSALLSLLFIGRGKRMGASATTS